jgi:protein-S-isoprenylcysteine O-methyltransferase Ste14
MDNNSELVFRITVGAVIATWIAVRIYFQKKVGGGEKISERHSRREKASYMLVSLSFFPIFLYVFAGLFGFAHFAVPGWARWLGVAVGFSGSALFAWTHLVLGKNWSGVLEIAKDHELVTNGPYQFVRHPMYSAFFLMGIGVLLLSANWLVGGLNLVAVTYMYFIRVADEEAMMLNQFGHSYEAYMRNTGRLFPQLWK